MWARQEMNVVDVEAKGDRALGGSGGMEWNGESSNAKPFSFS